MSEKIRVLITGANGFIAHNLVVRLAESGAFDVRSFVRGDSSARLMQLVADSDVVVHLAGENRPTDPALFDLNNAGLTKQLCDAILSIERPLTVLMASSTQAQLDNPYGRSKSRAEGYLRALAETGRYSAVLYRLPGVFGKWGKPHYNSVVATFCHQIGRGLPIEIRDPDALLELVYVDDVVESMLGFISRKVSPGLHEASVTPKYQLTLGDLAKHLYSFGDCRSSLMGYPVGAGLLRALYATYVSYLPVERFSYPVKQHKDPRGVFVEMLKSPDCGQFSFFTMRPGVARGSHYHHSKTEKFLVVSGAAKMRFKHLLTDEYFEIELSASNPVIVDTIPGWIHDIVNTSDGETVVMLWANEVFDPSRPDTVAGKVA